MGVNDAAEQLAVAIEEMAKMEARIRDLEAERDLLQADLDVADQKLTGYRTQNDIMAAQIEAAWVRMREIGARDTTVGDILSADSEVRARILAEHDEKVRADERARIAGDEWHPRAAKKRGESNG